MKLVYLLIALAVSISSNPTCAQTGQSPKPQIYGAPDGLTGDDCEGIMMRLDFVAIAAEEAGRDPTIIIIARPGNGERGGSLSRVRLKQVADYLNRRVARERIISAEGSRVRGLGQLEFYVGGKLHIVFKVRRNRDLVRGCGEDDFKSNQKTSSSRTQTQKHLQRTGLTWLLSHNLGVARLVSRAMKRRHLGSGRSH